MAKLWKKTDDTNDALAKKVNQFTAGEDRLFDQLLAKWDILGNMAHAKMLAKVKLIREDEFQALHQALQTLLEQAEKGTFVIDEGVEDVHSQVEMLLTEQLGSVGGKIHTARSRNDQVLVDLKLFLRNETLDLAGQIKDFVAFLLEKSELYKEKLFPGYTHFQPAMPSSFGLWFGAYAEALADDLDQLSAAYTFINKNPLGSAAGYGSSFPIDRDYTTELLGFQGMHVNVVNAQMARGKTERITAGALSTIAQTLAQMAMDMTLYMSMNYKFVSFPDVLTTGSSIMPHKKNPDVFELVRAKCNVIKALPFEIQSITANLPSGYHRDYQETKGGILAAFKTLSSCMEMMEIMFTHIKIENNIMDSPQYKLTFSVEKVNKYVLEGLSFREAYHRVAAEIAEGTFDGGFQQKHSLQGSLHQLENDRIAEEVRRKYASFDVKWKDALEELVIGDQ